MGVLSIWHILLVAFLVLVLFGRGKVSDLMADVAKGVKAFKKGLTEGDQKEAAVLKTKNTTDSHDVPDKGGE